MGRGERQGVEGWERILHEADGMLFWWVAGRPWGGGSSPEIGHLKKSWEGQKRQKRSLK